MDLSAIIHYYLRVVESHQDSGTIDDKKFAWWNTEMHQWEILMSSAKLGTS